MTEDTAFHPKAHCFSVLPTSCAPRIAAWSLTPLSALHSGSGLVISLPLPSSVTSGLPQLSAFLGALVPILWTETSFILQRGKRTHVAHTASGQGPLPESPPCLPVAVCISLSLTSRLLPMKLGEFAGPDFWSQAEASSKDSL